MTFFQWRRFNFFDISKDVDEGSIDKALQGHNMTAFASGRGHLVLADDDGQLHFITRHFKVSSSLKAFQRGVHLVHLMRQSGLVLAVGEDDPGVNPCLKVFNLDKLDKQGNASLVRTTRLILSGRASQPVCLAAHENQSLLALGFTDGTVVLYRGDITRDRGAKQKVILQGGGAAVSGLSFRSTSKDVHLYVATTNSVFCFSISSKDSESHSQLDNVGCPLGVAISADSLQDTHFITGRKDAVYCYTFEGRGQCYAFEGDKTALHWFRNYLVTVSTDTAVAVTPNGEQQSPRDDLPGGKKQTLTIFDVQNKFIAFTAPIRSVKALLSEWGLLFAITTDNRIIQLAEKDIQSKLDILFKKNFYDIAVKVAKMQQYNEEGLVDIFRQYGDHLYTKGDYAGAIENYCKTIGHLEPSYIIKRFLDAHKIHFLTEYLEALHAKGLANEDHTTLLLNCYTKLKDYVRLDDFILKKDKENVDFDVEIAIKVCRQSGFSKHALALAEKHQKHESYLQMQIEDAKGYKDALDYIAKLDFDSAEHNMRKYGSALMRRLPNETTDLLKKLCTDYRASDEPLVSEEMLQGEDDDPLDRHSADAEQFLHLFVKNSDKMVDFLEYMIKVKPATNGSVYTTLLEHYLHQYTESKDPERRQQQEDKVMAILRNSDANYHEDQALILCQRHAFRKGALHLFEKKGLYGQILSSFVASGDVAAALQTCRKFGPQDPNLWVQALQYVSRGGQAQPTQVEEILNMVERYRLLSPMLVVSTLSQSTNACLNLARTFLKRNVEAEDKQMADDKAIIDKYQEETKEMRSRNEKIRTSAITFQVSKCVACQHPLELPCVLFLCKHCYHQHCFQSYADAETECPACHLENKKILDIIASQKRSCERHDEFHHQLETAEDSFAVVAEYFGRGMFRKPLAELTQQMQEVKLINQSFRPESGVRLSERLEAGTGSEARIRAGERRSEVLQPQPSEGRLRAEAKNPSAAGTARTMAEGRLRTAEQESRQGRPISDARMRQVEGDRRRELAGSLDAHLTRDAGPRKPLKFQEVPTPRRREDIKVKEYNPFDNPDLVGENPFGNPEGEEEELGKDNPFTADQRSAPNPFDSPDHYDESLNPFGDS